MIKLFTRSLCLMAGVSGAAVLSQYPAFTQAYTQRLGGQVDALTEVVADFDRSAFAAGLTRTEAMAELQGSTFLAARNTDMTRTFARHAVLSDNLAQLRAATPLQQLAMPHRLMDRATIDQTLQDFTPAFPLNVAGLSAAAAGFVAGWAGLAAILALLASLVRPGRRAVAQAGGRIDPPLHRTTQPNTTARRPVLMGETRP